MVGFLNYGYSGSDFVLTKEQLGVYLPVEHIDNPTGYSTDARKYDPRLRGPVTPQEVAIDFKLGMKNYIATRGGGWDTSADYIKRTMLLAVQEGRTAFQEGDEAAKRLAYRDLGAAVSSLADGLPP